MPAPRRLIPVVLALGLTATSVPTGAGPTDAADAPAVPETLAHPARELAEGLRDVAKAEDVQTARQAHSERVQPAGAHLLPYAADLADDDGRLLRTYLDRLDARLDAGNLSDARSLAGAAANLVREEIHPAAKRWETNRTAVMAGPLQRTDEGLRVSLVLLNPPPAGIAAYDASLTVKAATPGEAEVALGQGTTRLDPANGTVRWASFDATSMARLSPQGAQRVALGHATLQADELDAGQAVATNTSVAEVMDPQGREVPVVGLAGSRTVPEEGSLGIDTAWVALAGVGVAGLGLGLWVRRWEV